LDKIYQTIQQYLNTQYAKFCQKILTNEQYPTNSKKQTTVLDDISEHHIEDTSVEDEFDGIVQE